MRELFVFFVACFGFFTCCLVSLTMASGTAVPWAPNQSVTLVGSAIVTTLVGILES